MNCSACREAMASQEDYLRCSLDTCKKVYHVLCSGVTNATNKDKSTWVCPECCCSTKKGGDNSLTPVGTSKKTRDQNVTFRKRTGKESQPKCEEPGELAMEIRGLRSEISILREQLLSAVALISTYETKLEGYATQIVALNAKLEEHHIKAFEKLLSTHSHSTREPMSKIQKMATSNPINKGKNKAPLDRPTPSIKETDDIPNESPNGSRVRHAEVCSSPLAPPLRCTVEEILRPPVGKTYGQAFVGTAVMCTCVPYI
ncbi:unnamed protein product [Euphydryas editha]|uniref:PHD-type domain-containing protein n=1 Tax=Euphydryas editha TaxID=104508 RepID=A0AAU9TMA8_EUPED|nr:unnamed protein product [Euphydryas editha]